MMLDRASLAQSWLGQWMRETAMDGIFRPSVEKGVEKRGFMSYDDKGLRAREQQLMTEAPVVDKQERYGQG